MNRRDWRLPQDYEHLKSLDAPGFAWEFLNRNPAFAQDLQQLERKAQYRVLNPAEVDGLVQRWSLVCRKGSADPPGYATLGAARAAQRHPRHDA